MKTCIECKHSRFRDGFDCLHPSYAQDNPVYGVPLGKDCWGERKHGACGMDGKLWEPRPPKRTFLQWLFA